MSDILSVFYVSDAGMLAAYHEYDRVRIALLTLVLVGCVGTAHAERPERIVLVGDSISTGNIFAMRSSPTDYAYGWPARVKAARVVRLVNLSIGGATAKNWALEPALSIHYRTPLVTWGMIALGGNDAYTRTVFQFYADLLTISDKMFDAGAQRVVLLLMPTANGLPATAYVRRQYNALQAAMCEWLDEFVCIDASDMPLGFFPPVLFLGLAHDVHPTPAGHVWLAERVLREVLTW